MFGRSHTFVKIGGFSIIPLKENAIAQYNFTAHQLSLPWCNNKQHVTLRQQTSKIQIQATFYLNATKKYDT